ncbi:MAG TPA: flagellar biosynthetic protein FliO [Bryobacteraceae bacterium]|nr:flagellar biosynthetic protein FliO [Bryobacteraceae bacterium]
MVELGQIVRVAGVLLLLGLTLWFLRRRGTAGRFAARTGSTRRLEHLERLSLGPHHTLHLVRCGDSSLLVASSPGGCSVLESIPPETCAGRLEAKR